MRIYLRPFILNKTCAIISAYLGIYKLGMKTSNLRDVEECFMQIRKPPYSLLDITAVLEEGGIFGFLLFCGFLLIAFPLLLSRQAYLGTCALFVFLISNLGEFTFFSTSANGGLLWAVTFVGLTLDAQRVARLRYQNAMGFRAFPPSQSFSYPTPYAPNGTQAYLP